jgi:hypothetical protein
MEGKEGYNVVLRNTKNTGFYEGIVRWQSFESKEALEKWYTPEIKECQAIVEEGVSEERAIELTSHTPFACRIASAVKEATNSSGEINEKRLKSNVEKAIFAENAGREHLGLPILEQIDLTALMMFIIYFI